MNYSSINGILTSDDFTLESTWVNSKLTCHRDAYVMHVMLCYVTFLAGLLCMITRFIPRIKWTHPWFGRLYILAMLWNTFSSLLISRTGLPVNTIILFCFLMVYVAIGWPLAVVHRRKLNDQAMANVTAEMVRNGGLKCDIQTAVEKEKTSIVTMKSGWQRFFSYKAAHGILMAMSWGFIGGRIFGSDLDEFQCYSYPVLKPINAEFGYTKGMDLLDKPLQFVGKEDIFYDRKPWARIGEWGFSLIIVFAQLFIGLAINAAVSYYNGKKAVALRQERNRISHQVNPEVPKKAWSGSEEDSKSSCNKNTDSKGDVEMGTVEERKKPRVVD